ncbi:uncharacterized protein LOC124419407 [Lucilia cuprina]|uniref:uncharacterized protein LOC124419407 n=1 Tax=Lucilia cuprina TaxID=7375 RepID=UPI001F053082|nr:uncharacterized protein LOC124419407 [Lucilia cuprina]
MLEFLATSNQEDPPNSDLQKEIKSYFDVPNEDAECLEWWQKNEEMFPNIALLANFCFGIPATSASSEEAFSVAGACITAKRSRLNPSTVKRQLFVHDNYHLVDPILNSK